MQKKNRKKSFWSRFGRMMAYIGIALMMLFLGIYLSTPIYTFNEPRPFSGEYLYNPYQDINPDQWKKYNFHCHSRRFFGLTDGRQSKEPVIDSIYQFMGYDHYGISDYMSINRHNAENEDYIPAYEHGYGLFRKTHQLCIGAEKVWKIDYPFMQNLNIKQHVINKLGEHSRFVIPAHASFTDAYKPKEMAYLSNYRLLEILNPYGIAIEHWDVALSNGHRVYGIGSDDTHNVLNPHEVARNIMVINVPDMKEETVCDALEKGQSYVLKFDNEYYYHLPFETMSKDLRSAAYLKMAKLSGDTLFVETSADLVKAVAFIGQDGKTLKTQENVKTAFYVIQPEDTYVRTRIDLNDYQHIYLNPVTRHFSSIIIDTRLDSVNVALTTLYYLVYVVVLIIIVRYAIRKMKAKKTTATRQNTDSSNR